MSQGPKTIEEQIGVKSPKGGHHIVTVKVNVMDSDEDILKQLSREVGTVFNITGTKYKVLSVDPFKVTKIGAGEQPLPEVLPLVGETWKPKDTRRKNTFKVVEVDGDAVVTDDGRRIQLSRFNRYERLLAD